MPPYAQMTIRSRGGALPRYNGGDEVYVSGRGVSARYDYQSDRAIRIQAQANQDALRRSNIGPALIQFGQTVNMWENNYAKTKAQDLFTQYERAMNELLEGENGLLTMKGERAFGTPEANGVPGTACSGGSCKQVYTVGPTEETDPSTFGLPVTQTATAAASTSQPPLNPGDPDAIQQIGRPRNPIPGSFGRAFFRQQNIQTGRRCVSGSCSGINNIRATRANALRDQLLDGQYWHVRNIFNRLADDYDAKADLRVRKYQTAQFNKWQDDVDDASIAQYLERAAANADNPEEFNDNLNRGMYHAKNKMERAGMATPLIEENLKSIKSGAYRDAANNLIDNGDFAGAEALLNGNTNYSLAYGRVEEGNIEKASGAPQDSSPVRTVTIPTEKGYTIVPSVDSSGQPVTTDGAIEQYQTSGKNYGSYATEDAARLATRQLVTANDVMNTKDKQRVLRHLETAKQKVKKEKSINDNFAKREVMTNINSDIADLLRGKPVDTSHYTKEYFEEQLGATDQAAALYQKVRIAEGAQPHIAALANATRAERAKTMGSLNPTSHDEIEHGIYDAVVAANAQFEKDLAEDPAGIFMGGYNNINLEGDSTLQALHGQAMQDGNWQPYISRFQELARYYGVPTSTSFDNKTALILPDSEITALKNQIFTGLSNADITQRVPATLGVIQSLQGQYGGYFTDVMAQLSGKDDAKYLAHLVPVADLDIRRPEQLSAAQYMLDGIIGDLGGSDDKIYTAAGIIKKSDREEFDARINERSSGFLNTLPYGIRQNYEKTISRGVLAAMAKGGMSEENAAALIAGAFDDTFMYSGKTLIRRSLVEAANINDSGQQIIQGELETEEIMSAFSRMTNRHLPANTIGRQAEYEWVSDGGNGFNMVYINGANQAAFVPDENGQPCKATYSDIINEMREGRIDAIQRDMDGYNGTFENWMVEHKDQQSDLARVAYDRHNAKRSEAREEVARKSTPEYKAKQKELKESAERNRLADRIIGSYSDEQLVTIYNDSMSRDEMMASLGLGSRQGRRLAWTTDEFQEFFFNERLPKAVEAAQGRIDEGKQRRAQAEEQAAKDRAVRVDNAWKLVQENEALLNNIEQDLGDLTIENNDDITYAKAVIRQWLDMFYPVGSWGDSENILPYYNEMTDKLLKKYIE